MPLRRRRIGAPRLRTLPALPLALAPSSALALMLVLMLAGCAKPATPPPQPAAMALPLPPPPPVTRPVLRAVWNFDTAHESCIMAARTRRASLLLNLRPEGPIRLIVSLPAPSPPDPAAHFTGPAGQWTIGGTALARDQAAFPLPRNETTLGRILMILSGGTLDLRPDAAGLPILSLPESGAAGREWFACARRSVTGL